MSELQDGSRAMWPDPDSWDTRRKEHEKEDAQGGRHAGSKKYKKDDVRGGSKTTRSIHKEEETRKGKTQEGRNA